MSEEQSKRPPIEGEPLPLRPNRRSPEPDILAQDVYDQDGNRTGVIVGDVFHPVQDPRQSRAASIPGVVMELFEQQENVIAQAQRRVTDQIRDRHYLDQRDIEAEYEGELLGGIRSEVAKFRDGLEHHQQMREIRSTNRQAWNQVNQRMTNHIFEVMDIHAEMHKTQLAAGLVEYQREQRERDARFEADLALKPTREAQAHERDLAAQKQGHKLRLKTLEVEERKLERADARAEAALDREHQLNQRVIDMGHRLPDLLADLRLLEQEQPEVVMQSTVDLVRSAMAVFGSLGTDMEKKDRETYAPLIERAFNEAWKTIHRYRGGNQRGGGAK